MAWLFGQVWLLCLIAFLLGALFTWLFFVRPRRTIGGAAAEPSAAVAPAEKPEPVDTEPVPAGPVPAEPAKIRPATSEPVEKAAAPQPAQTAAVATAVAEKVGPHGPGSAKPNADGSAPSPEYMIKGNAQSKLFHTEKSPYYKRTKAEVWFATAEDAERAGFTAWRRTATRER